MEARHNYVQPPGVGHSTVELDDERSIVTVAAIVGGSRRAKGKAIMNTRIVDLGRASRETKGIIGGTGDNGTSTSEHSFV